MVADAGILVIPTRGVDLGTVVSPNLPTTERTAGVMSGACTKIGMPARTKSMPINQIKTRKKNTNERMNVGIVNKL